MNQPIHCKTTILPVLIVIVLTCFALSPTTLAVSPPPDGGYPGANTAEGQNALLSLATGGYNAAIGWLSLRGLTSGSYNTGVGAGTLALNNADQNTAVGTGALLFNSSGGFNTATGAFALFHHNTGSFNNAFGRAALFNHTSGDGNVAIGDSALANTAGGNSNVAIGNSALTNSSVGDFNIALGFFAGEHIAGNNNIDIGNGGVASDNDTIRIGNGSHTATYMAGISGATIISPVPVLVDSTTGQLGTMVSSRRFKKEIKPMDKASEAILALKPVTFNYKSDKMDTPQFGLIAEDVAEANPDLVVRDKRGEIYTVRYDAINAMLLNEFLKEHRKVEEQEATIAQWKKDFQIVSAQQRDDIQLLRTQLKAQAVQIQKVSAQLEVNKAPPQIALSDR